MITSESAELVKCEEDMGDVPDMSSDIHHLRRICHLHCWNPVYHIRVPREHCCRDSGPYTLCRRLWTWLVFFFLFFSVFLDVLWFNKR